MYNVDIYTDNHDRCGDILVPGKTLKNFFVDCRIMKNRVIRDDTPRGWKLQL
jgi:hypothetical protein